MKRILTLASDVLDSIHALLWPDRCVLCGAFPESIREGALCVRCRESIPRLDWPGVSLCPACGIPAGAAFPQPVPCPDCAAAPPPYDAARAGWAYAGDAREVLHQYKFNGISRLHRQLAAVMADTLARIQPAWEIDLVCAVPLHRSRERERGFDQAELLARSLARRVDRPFGRLLKRRRRGSTQSRTPLAERSANVAGAYAVRRGKRLPGRVLLVDDVHTTGATLAECARVLKEAGAERVYALTLCRVEKA